MSIIPEFGLFCPTHGWKGWMGKFCFECGAKLEKRPAPKCSWCGRDVIVGTFCPHCGTELPKKEVPV